jgi:glycosyltransferase involved in cell wall biosynthesis
MPTVVVDTSDAADPRARGWGRYVRELTAGMRELDPPDLDLRFLVRDSRGPELVWEQVRLPRLLRREGAHAVHAPNCFLPLRRPCPGVVTIHDLAFEDHPEDFARRTGWKYRTFAPRAARSAQRVICVSEFTRDDVCRRYGVDRERTRVVLSAPTLPHTHAEPPDGPYLLAVGDLRGKKNVVRLAQAFRALHAEGLPHRLVLAGIDSGEGPRVLEAAGDAPVELTGWVTDERLDALMRGADALVHPSLYEGFGLVLVEAMARGCPVVAARATVLPETGGDAAAYFDPLDPADMARAIREVVEDQSLRAELIARGRARAAGLSWENTARATLDVYREVLA